MDKNKVYVLQHRQGFNFLRWLWLSTNLFVTIKFHNIQEAIDGLPDKGGTIYLLPEIYLMYKPIELRDNVHMVGSKIFRPTSPEPPPVRPIDPNPMDIDEAYK